MMVWCGIHEWSVGVDVTFGGNKHLSLQENGCWRWMDEGRHVRLNSSDKKKDERWREERVIMCTCRVREW